MPVVKWCAYCVTAVCLSFPIAAQGQKDVPNRGQVIEHVRTLYYIPTTAGLRSFTCRAKVNWRAVLENDSAVEADDPRFKFLDKLEIKFTGFMDGRSEVLFVPPPEKYPSGTASYWDLRDEVTGGFRSFMLGWSLYLNGTFLPKKRDEFHLVRIPNGYDLYSATDGTLVDEKLGPHYVVREYHVKTHEVDVDLHMTFLKTPGGLLFNGYEGENTTVPPKAGQSPDHLEMHVTYQMVGGFRIPRVLEMQQDGRYDFTFTNCKVNEDVTAVNPSVPTKAN